GELVDDGSQFWQQEVESLSEEDEIGIVGAVAAGSCPAPSLASIRVADIQRSSTRVLTSQVNDSSSSWSDFSKSVDMSHDIMSSSLFLLGSDLEVLLGQVEMLLHLVNGFLGDCETQFLLGLREPKP